MALLERENESAVKSCDKNCNGHTFQNGEVNLSLKELHTLPPCTLSFNNVVTLNLNYNNIEELPEAMCDTFASSLTHLFVKGNNLTRLPDNIDHLRQLTVLDASENSICHVPDNFTRLQRLEIVKLIGNQLKQLPSTIQDLVSLSELHLDENKFRTLPEKLGELQQLQRLEMSNNKLRKLPDNLGNLKKLKYLNVGYNRLRDLPATTGLLPSLEEIDVSHNRLKQLPAELTSACRLRKLYADNNAIMTLPPWFRSLESLEELSLRGNQLQNSPFPAGFGEVSCRLRLFDLAGNYIESLPDSFGQMRDLEVVHLGSCMLELERSAHLLNGNWIGKLPENFGHVTMLKHLRVDENQLEQLPESFGELLHLETLDLGQNKLTSLPESFGKLRSLKTCLLSRNFIELLPESFGELNSLTELRFDNNLLKALPESFKDLTQIQILDLFNNQLSEVPFCLQFMTHLKYLELDENKFGVPLGEVPRIIRKGVYAERDPKLKDDWRGRGRRDLENFYGLVEEIEGTSANGETASDETQKRIDVIVAALQQGSAIWRSHAQTGARVKFDHGAGQMTTSKHLPAGHVDANTPVAMQNDGHDDLSKVCDLSCADSQDDSMSSSDEAEKNWDSECSEKRSWPKDDIMDCSSDQVMPNSDEDAISITAEEDWDAEIEKTNPFHVYDDFPVYSHRPMVLQPIGFHPKNAFCPADNHAKPIMRLKFYAARTEPGQFDDAESS